jgi:hypothetical protein
LLEVCSRSAELCPAADACKGAPQLYEAYRDRDISLEAIEGCRYRRIVQIKGGLSAGDLDGALRRKAA